MKLNGVIILRIADLKRFFDFTAFWTQRKEFVDLVKSGGGIDPYFFDTPEERALGSIVCNWIEADGRPEKFTSRIENDAIRLAVGREVLIPLNGPLRRMNARLQELKIKPLLIIGLISLYKMLGADKELSDITINISECLRVLGFGVADFSEAYIPLASDTAIPECPKRFPLVDKPIVNKSEKAIRLTYKGQVVELKAGECVVGLFHDDKCCTLLPRTAQITDGSLEIKYNASTEQTDLEIVNIMSGRTQIGGVISFYSDKFGYAYVRTDGKCEINPQTHYGIFSAVRNCRLEEGERILAIDCTNTIPRIITSLNEY